MSFDFGVAKKLYAKSQHPRILVDESSLAVLRKKVRTGTPKKLMNALRAFVKPLVEFVEKSDNVAGMFAHHTVRKDPSGGRVIAGLCEIAIVGAVDKDERAINAVRAALAAFPAGDKLGPRDSYRPGYGHLHIMHHAYDLVANYMTKEERAAYTQWTLACSIRESLVDLRKVNYLRCAGQNIAMVGMITALHGLLAIEGDEGVPDLAAEKAELLRFFESTMFTQMGENGYPHEDIAYGTGMVAFTSLLVEALRRAGLYDAYTQCPRYLKFADAMLHFVQPWGKYLSNTGDYGADFGPRAPIFPRQAAVTKNPAVLWLHGQISYPIAAAYPLDASQRRLHNPELQIGKDYQIPVDYCSLITIGDLKKPVHPLKAKTRTEYVDRDRGIVTFRSSWRDDATFVVFDGAQRSTGAQGHAHDSGSHFSLSALGEYFAIDTGRYCIEQDQHNVVLVDGKGGQTTNGEWRATWYSSVLTGYNPRPFVDTAKVTHSQASDCYWAHRTLGLVKDPTNARVPAYVWTVEDINKSNDYREFWWQLQANPAHKITIKKDHATVTGSDHGNHLDVFIGMPYPPAYPKPSTLEFSQNMQQGGSHAYMWDKYETIQALYKKQVGHEAYGPSWLRPRLVAKVSSYAGRFMSLMIPRVKGGAMPKVERLDSMDNTLAMRVTFGDIEDTIIWAYEHHLLEAGDILARGDWCVVRRSKKTGRVLAHEMSDGTRLEVGGKKIV